MSKTITNSFEALKKLQQGMEKLANAVKITLGPKGHNVILDRENDNPLITNDGVTIAKAIELHDKIENMGAKLLKTVSIKTNDYAGDGTTTACVLAEGMIRNGLKNYIAGADPISLRDGMQKAVQKVVEYLNEIAIPVQNPTEINQIASISAGSIEIGNLIQEAFERIGEFGTITLEDSKTTKTECQIVEGFSFDRGYLSPYFCNQMEKMQITLQNALILFSLQPIHKIQDIMKALELSNQASRPLLIIASDIDQEVLQALILNKLRGTLNVACVKAPEFGDRQRAVLEDMSTICGGIVIGSQTGYTFDQFDASFFGECHSVTITQDSTILVGNHQNNEKIEQRKKQIQLQIDSSTNPFDKHQLELRLSKLCGGVAVIRVGGTTDIEQNELRLRIEDSINATKSATKEGIVCGGGIALLQARKTLLPFIESLSGDEKTGAIIIYESLKRPFEQICKNAHQNADVIMEHIENSNLKNCGYDAKHNQLVNMIENGIIDPKKVTRCALENACSVTSTILTTSVVIAND